jgi:hypothetical protein
MPPSDLLDTALDSLRGDPDQLVRIIRQQAQIIAELRSQTEALTKANDHLTRRLETLERESKRQAAPFRRDEAKRKGAPSAHEPGAAPGKPGRKGGHQAHFRRKPEQIDEHIEVPFTEGCPRCGGALSRVRAIEQFIEELPPMRPQVTRLVSYEGQCACCGQVETSHPLKTSRAVGAAAVQLGPRAQAMATALVYEHGLPLRRVCRVLERLFGLRLTAGGLAQLLHRQAARLSEAEEALLANAQSAPVQYVDETSWWVAGADRPNQWLWVFADEAHTLYRVAERRRRQVAVDILASPEAASPEVASPEVASSEVASPEVASPEAASPEAASPEVASPEAASPEAASPEAGPRVLVSDCLNLYDSLTGPGSVLGAQAKQQKCYAHHLRAISAAQATYRAVHDGAESAYLRQVRGLLTGALALGKAAPEASAPDAARGGKVALTREAYQRHRAALEVTADRLLRQDRADPQEEQVRRRLAKQRTHLFVFLDHAGVDATNNLAERRLRPAVIRRKLSCGNRSERGARTWECVASVVATCVQQGRDVLRFLERTASRYYTTPKLR